MRTSVRIAMEGGGLKPNQKGAIAEEVISAEATKLGIVVSRPNVDAGVVKVNLVSSWCTPSGYARTAYAVGEVDLFAVYCGEQNRCYLLGADWLVGRRAIWLRLSEPRNGQRACVNLASDFTFDGAIAQLGERLAGSQQVAGSSPASSTSCVPPTVVGANRFRDRFGWYMERAAAGEVFEITRHGRPFARIMAPD